MLKSTNKYFLFDTEITNSMKTVLLPGENLKQQYVYLGTGKRGHIVADTLLPTQMFPRLPARATFVADTNFVSGTQKMFLILVRNILCPQQMFPSLRNPRNIMSNTVSATMCPRLPVPFDQHKIFLSHNKHEGQFFE